MAHYQSHHEFVGLHILTTKKSPRHKSKGTKLNLLSM